MSRPVSLVLIILLLLVAVYLTSFFEFGDGLNIADSSSRSEQVKETITVIENTSTLMEKEKIINSAIAPKLPGVNSQDLISYGKMCALAIKAIPHFNCMDGKIIPMTVNGETPDHYKTHMDCDFPPLLPLGENGQTGKQGQCIPYSRILNFSEQNNQIVAACRQKQLRSKANSHFFDEIDVIAHNTADGSTCWFQALSKSSVGLDGRKVPSPSGISLQEGYPNPQAFWQTPFEVATEKPKNCGYCHDNDPFMYSPYIAQVWDQVPTDPLGYYQHLGSDFAWWKTVSLTTRDNTCVGCHRIGLTFTSGQGAKESSGQVLAANADDWAKHYPQTHWMPAGNSYSLVQWQTIYQKSVMELIECNQNPRAVNCIVEEISKINSDN